MDPLTLQMLLGGTAAPQAFPNNPAMPAMRPDAVVAPDPSVLGATYPTLGASLAGAKFQDPATVAGSVGGNVANAPVATPFGGDTLPSGATSTMGQMPGSTGAGGGSSIRDALRGVTAPAPPQAQTVRTPAAPALAPIKGGELISMLTSLGIGPQDLMRMKLGVR